MKCLTVQDILLLHARIVAQTGGVQGVRDVHLFASLVERPKTSFGGQESFSSVFAKAAAYVEALVNYHVFLDGNKRTAIAAGSRFLFMNGYKFTGSNAEVEKFVLRVAREKVGVPAITSWLRQHSKKI